MYFYDSQSDYDTDCDSDSDSDELLTIEQALGWIRDEQIYDSENDEYIDMHNYYGELDCQAIVDRTSESDLEGIITALLEEDIEKHLDIIKQFVNISDITIDYHVLNDALEQSVENNIEEAVEFCITQGASEEVGIEAAIIANSEEMLDLLGAQTTDEYVEKAIEKKCFKAMDYFLKEDFNTSSEIILSEAAETSNKKLVEVVCENAELDQVYDLIKCLVKEGGEKLIYVFIDHFDVEKLLTEVQEQDGNKGFYSLVLECAKRRLPELNIDPLKMNQLLSKFDKLNIDSGILSYPDEEFNGNSALKEIRNELSKNFRLNEENRFAATFIGTTFSTVNRYLTETPHHKFAKEKSETYFRSAKHPFSISVTPQMAQYSPDLRLPESKAKMGQGAEAHLGLYKPPLDSLNDAKKIKKLGKINKKLANIVSHGKLYDIFLRYKHNICRYITSETNFDDKDAIKVGFYHNYPCIMLWIKKPKSAPSRATKKALEKALNAWTEAIISYFIGVVNYTAQRNGLDIELVRRSSFGFLTPTVAPCDQSIRINVGVIPSDYADVLIECLKILNVTLNTLNDVTDSSKFDIELRTDLFLFKSGYKKYKGSKNIPVVKNLIELIWAKVEKGGKTTIQNLVRSSIARDALSAQVYDTMCSHPDMVGTQVLLNMLRFGFSKINVKEQGNKSSLGCKLNGENSYMNPLQKSPVEIKDDNFFKFVRLILKTIRKEQQSFESTDSIGEAEKKAQGTIRSCIEKSSIQGLYYNLEVLSELLYSRTLLTEDSIIDEFGSDSEVEDNTSKQKIFGRKIIVRNGIRAILASLHVGANHLYPDYLQDLAVRHPVALHGAYYETADAAKLLAKFEIVDIFSVNPNPKILIYDVNACITEGVELRTIHREHLSKITVLIIDSTSSTIARYQVWIKKFKQQKNMQVLFFVSSGFKNEQMGADKNPYGTIRIFTKEKQLLSKLMAFIKEVETPVKSSISHQYRRMMKRLGNIPTNKAIIKVDKKNKKAKKINTVPRSNLSITTITTTMHSTDHNIAAVSTANTINNAAVTLQSSSLPTSSTTTKQDNISLPSAPSSSTIASPLGVMIGRHAFFPSQKPAAIQETQGVAKKEVSIQKKLRELIEDSEYTFSLESIDSARTQDRQFGASADHALVINFTAFDMTNLPKTELETIRDNLGELKQALQTLIRANVTGFKLKWLQADWNNGTLTIYANANEDIDRIAALLQTVGNDYIQEQQDQSVTCTLQ